MPLDAAGVYSVDPAFLTLSHRCMRGPVNDVARLACLICVGLLAACSPGAWNVPYPTADADRAIFYTTFQERPKHLDPALSYSENEAAVIAQIYEPLLQYHYLKRPFELAPLTADRLPEPMFLDAAGAVLPADAPDDLVARTVYRIRIKAGIRYAPHPAFAADGEGGHCYHGPGGSLPPDFRTLADFHVHGTRELVAQDYVYQIKRLVHPRLQSPIAGVMVHYVHGLAALAERLRTMPAGTDGWLDLRGVAFDGARALDDHTLEITLDGKYPQFIYWLAMPFFAPMPWEAERFYAQPGMAERNLSLEWYPVGTGPYVLRENNPNARMVLARNPNFHGETYPSEGMPEDAAAGLLAAAGKPLPMIDEVHFMLEKEEIPTWAKFLQGYYDASPIAPDGFDQAIRFTPDGRAELTPTMQARELKLTVATQPSVSYLGFNMLDGVVGGSSERARKLRQALSIAIDMEEMISIFSNGRGVPAHGPLPPGIFGFREGEAGMNPVTHAWQGSRAVRRPLADAKRLLAEAGYPDGIDPATGEPLTLYFDATGGGPDDKSRFSWFRKQCEKLGLRLVVRLTDYNRFQDKMRNGDAQLFSWGWNADYPDPENFLFLLYGPNGKAGHQGENASNYANPAFDQLFREMRGLPNGEARQAVIDRMVRMVREDAPWVWGYNAQSYALQHQWLGNGKPNTMARNTLKYRSLDVGLRKALREEWNSPRRWPLAALLAGLVAASWMARRIWRQRQEAIAR